LYAPPILIDDVDWKERATKKYVSVCTIPSTFALFNALAPSGHENEGNQTYDHGIYNFDTGVAVG
jgi:hypothetical protein